MFVVCIAQMQSCKCRVSQRVVLLLQKQYEIACDGVSSFVSQLLNKQYYMLMKVAGAGLDDDCFGAYRKLCCTMAP